MRIPAAILAAVLVAIPVATAQGHSSSVHSAQANDPLGHSTRQQTLVGPDPQNGYMLLRRGPGEAWVVRQDLEAARHGRAGRRGSLGYFGQITDFQLSDEESPARVEFFDIDPSGTATSAWRPQEALVAHQVDWTIRQMNRFLRSPVSQRGGRRARMLNAVMTGDLADNMQRNETEWVIRLLEGGRVDPNSGTSDLSGTVCPPGTPLDDPRNYTGVQDYDDYLLDNPNFYDPDVPRGPYDDWPTYPGLLDRAQQPFTAEGLKVPSYIAFGNHDNLVQGNEDAIAAYEEVATGCVKPLQPSPGFVNPLGPGAPEDALPPLADVLDPGYLQGAIGDPTRTMLVPPDPRRAFVDKREFKALANTGRQRDRHGFAYVDRAELDASNGAASYYAFTPRRGLRFIVLDTVAEGGVTPFSSDGNIDEPQFRWLERELRKASSRDQLIVLWGHHAATSLRATMVPDELAPPCTVEDEHGHDVNPGCDRDPRSSQPLHGGDDLTALLHRFPRAIAYVAGHSHENEIQPYKRPGGGGYWEVKSPAVVDWPPQHRLLEVMDNCDSTLSMFGTLLDHGGPAGAPASGTRGSNMNSRQLASVGRTLSYNDPQEGPDGSQGRRLDRNVELVIDDPRTGSATIRRIRLIVKPRRLRARKRTTLRVRVVNGNGRPVRGAVVRIAGRRATTGRSGRATLTVRVKGRRARKIRARATLPNACAPTASKTLAVRAARRARRAPSRRAPRFTGKRAPLTVR